MRIMEVINGLSNRGGAEVFLLNLCDLLKERDDCEILLISINDNIDDSLANFIETHNIPFISLKKRKKISPKSFRMFRKVVKTFKPDIMHFHLSCLKTYFLSFGAIKRKWKLVQTMHSIPGANIDKFETKLRKLFLKKKMLSFVAITDSLLAMAKLLYGYSDCYCVYNGIKLIGEPQKERSNLNFDFVVVASFTEAKNHGLLLNAVNILKTRYSNLKIACVGDGPTLKYCQEYVVDNQMSNNIIFLGKLNNVYPILNSAKCFLLTSKREGNPISILEALDAGLPIVAPRIGGIPDIVKDNVNGFLFETNNVDSMIVCLEKMLNDNMIVKKIGIINKEHSKNFSIEKCSRKYYNLFTKLKYGK